MSDLAALIEKLEKAEAGSKELDAEIAVAIGWSQDTFLHQWRWVSPDGERTAFDPSLDHATFLWFTRSLDAALTLVPEGWFCQIDVSPKGTTCFSQCDANDGVMLGRASRLTLGHSLSAPLALCIAALKARAA